MTVLNLRALYRTATRNRPAAPSAQTDPQRTAEELLRLIRGESLASRQNAALTELARSSSLASVARLAMATQAWSEDLAADLAAFRRPRLRARIATWFEALPLPPVFASCAIALLAIAAWRIGEPETTGVTAPPTALVNGDRLFDGGFDDGIVQRLDPDQVFSAGFDS